MDDYFTKLSTYIYTWNYGNDDDKSSDFTNLCAHSDISLSLNRFLFAFRDDFFGGTSENKSRTLLCTYG